MSKSGKRSSRNHDKSRRSPMHPSRSRSSSRGTFDGIEFNAKTRHRFTCRECRRAFDTIPDLAEHEIQNHECEIPCFQCEKKSVSVPKLIAHIKFRHGPKPVICFYCQDVFGKTVDALSADDWEEFEEHVMKEAINKRMYRHGTNQSTAAIHVAYRGIGSCPHGPPMKCKNFPHCPGAKCIYSHNMCRYENTCNKTTCPFDHPNRPRTCMTCINEMKSRHRPK